MNCFKCELKMEIKQKENIRENEMPKLSKQTVDLIINGLAIDESLENSSVAKRTNR